MLADAKVHTMRFPHPNHFYAPVAGRRVLQSRYGCRPMTLSERKKLHCYLVDQLRGPYVTLCVKDSREYFHVETLSEIQNPRFCSKVEQEESSPNIS